MIFLLFFTPLLLLSYFLFNLFLFLQKVGGLVKPPPAPPSARSLLLHEKCCFVLVVSFQIKLHPRLHKYVIKIDYQARWSVHGLKRTICSNNYTDLLTPVESREKMHWQELQIKLIKYV